jgi:hypothetical protein
MEGRDAEIADRLDQLAQAAEPDPKPRKGTRRARGKRGAGTGRTVRRPTWDDDAAGTEGLEPPTNCLEGSCSLH